MDYSYLWGTHLPVLIKAINLTSGDVLELGMGLYSTPYLHWACFPDRKLISYENNKDCYELNKQYQSTNHIVKYVENWDEAIITDRFWDVVLVDHAPSRRRITEIKRLVNLAKYIVIHDTQKNYKTCDYRQIWPLFKYKFDYKKVIPYTTVVSNFVDLSNFL